MQEIRLASGATEADIIQALAQAQSDTTIILPEGETISISKGLIADVTARNITLDLNGATLQQVGAVSVVLAKGTQMTAQSVELGTDAFGNTTISYANLPPNMQVGAWTKVVSDDALPGDKINGPAPTLMGQSLEIASIEGNVITLKGALIDQDNYTTNVRAATYQSGQFTLKNGEIIGDGTLTSTTPALVQMRDILAPNVQQLSVHDGIGYGISVVNGINASITDVSVINMLDGATMIGIAVHSLSSTGTTVKGLYAENVTHAADANAVGTRPGWPYLAPFGADIGLSVTDSVAYGARNFAWSWHSESVGGVFENVMAFDSYGFFMARGLGGTMTDSGGAGNMRGVVLYEWGHQDARNISLDYLTLKETLYYSTIAINSPLDNTLKNSFFESYAAGNNAPESALTVTDTVYVRAGENADDIVTGSWRDDLLLGGKGDDVLSGGLGDDYIWGGKGADSLTGGEGRDRFAYHALDEAGDTITDFEAGPNGDVIDLSVLAARLNWDKGDLIESGHARFLQDGDDVLVQLDADGGGDSFVTLATLLHINASLLTHANFHTDLWAPDLVDVPVVPQEPLPDPGISFNYPPGASINALYGDMDDNRLDGDDASNRLYGLGGNDRLYGHGDDDLLVGGDGNDELYGGDGDDVLSGGAGADYLHGGQGYDTVSYLASETGVIADLLDNSKNSGGASGDRYVSIENLTGSKFGDILIGNKSANVLSGGMGNDILLGGGGSDTLIGGDGNDWLEGGAWKDVLTGGAGADSFYFASIAEAGDTIDDFTSGEDKIVLSAAGFGISESEPYVLECAAQIYLYAGNAAYTQSSGPSLLYNTTNGRLLWDPDGNGAASAELFAVLTNAPQITFDDFLIV